MTILTQVGGFIWLLTVVVSKRFRLRKRYLFPAMYLICNLIVVPPIASYFGRTALPVLSDNLKPRQWVYPLMFRNYVSPKLKTMLEDTAETLSEQHIALTYLDANFPFWNGFPLLPHLSHNDGNKIDLSFQYRTTDGQWTDKKPTISGYGNYVTEEGYWSERCKELGYWQYNFPKYLSFGTIHKLNFDADKTRAVILQLVNNSATEKVFIEPYLKTELGLTNYSKIKFHGCHAVRHDDHIHVHTK
ncbi:MAG: hypothetical protein GYB32_04750 [Algicola sp.]|nr:hypothetical protein [Algicola sp.]